MASTDYESGKHVKWKWGSGWGRGQVTEKFTQDVERTIDGAEVKRNASDSEPAYLIEQEDGQQVLKSYSEIEADD